MKLVICLAVLLLTVGPCVGCTTGDLRLTGNSNGDLQVCKNNEWRIVCSQGWGNLDVAVACRQLGYDGGFTQHTYSSNPEGLTVDPVEYHCSGQESSLQNCDNQTSSRCSDGHVTTIACVRRNGSDPCSSGDIRLWGGQTEYEGNIEICTDHGVWSAVCDSEWDISDATVACRQLNFMLSIPRAYTNSVFGERSQPMEYGGLNCQGNESSLQECAASQWFENDSCDRGDHAGVRCTLAVNCTSGDLRLSGNSSGILQICKGNEWRIVCSQDWGHLDAAVACRQLGYDGGYTQNTGSSNLERIIVDPVEYHCNGNESNLQTCDYRANTRCPDNYVTTIECVQRNASDPCSSGDIRLWGGQTEYEGNIEMCTDHGVWSTVCDRYWGNRDAAVACRQLNYTSPVFVRYGGSKFGERIQPMEYGGLDCQGTESSLQQCAVSQSFVETYSHHFYCNQRDCAGVLCTPRTRATCKNGAVQLTGGYSPNNGYAEICIDDVWVGICLQSSPVISMLICKQLGYSRYTKVDQNFFSANRSEPQVYVSALYEYQCRSESSVLLDCVYNHPTYGISYLSHCTPHGILCCPNNAESCFQLPTTDDLTTPPAISTNSTPATPPSGGDVGTAPFSLHFGCAATPSHFVTNASIEGDVSQQTTGSKYAAAVGGGVVGGFVGGALITAVLMTVIFGMLLRRMRIKLNASDPSSGVTEAQKGCIPTSNNLAYCSVENVGAAEVPIYDDILSDAAMATQEVIYETART